ncbi:hypothetical protein OHA79_01985 [Streptomyces sp. NBC_00841]|uniref:hypothetical protein n=1 Tax=Streptomyces sp. NBC_00841 TaxID=2975847 RepID=UPI002DD7C989|nr:hypothetical protein [Streptomyces sp. NBC_00841]WRZ96818.1 hypothetical protein OHA79_01985 [Streptomyces sp. NBC_00841]
MKHEQHSEGEVHVLWHARHLAVEENGRIIHRDPDGIIHLDEEEWRIVGIYTTRSAAETQREASKDLRGFRCEPDCFEISPLVLDEDLWTDGFFTEYPDGLQQD